MTDFSAYTAGEIVDWMSQGVQMPTPPDPVYVTLFDDTGTELNGSVANGRVAVAAGTGWDKVGTDFDNAAEVNFGEATADMTNVQDVALYDSLPAGSNNELARYTLDTAPFDISTGTQVFFEAGQLTFDVVDNTE